MAEQTGRIIRISGPIIDAVGLPDGQMYEVLGVGEEHLIGELIRIHPDHVTIQVYENTTGLKPGGPVYRTGMPLSVTLGPGLVGNIYDGIQRPLPSLKALSGVFIKRGEKVDPIDVEKKWHLVPKVKAGEAVKAGQIIGTVQETHAVEHRVMAPPGVHGRLKQFVAEGDYTVQETIGLLDMDGTEVPLRMAHRWSVRQPRPYAVRKPSEAPLITGLRIIDTFFPLGRGGTAGIPGGFGTGKTMTQHSLAKWCKADIVVYIGCGERGNEMTEVLVDFPKLIDPRNGRPLMERTVLIANTSNMPVAAREVSIYTGVTLAEYFRDMGYDVAVMADSTSRWAEALRELSARLEEMPAEEGFPAYLPTKLAEFYERAGTVEALCGKDGSVSTIGAVSPPGGDFAEPVTQHTKRFIRCFWQLDTALAYARHYPSINWLHSYSEYAEDVAEWWGGVDADWAQLRERAMELLQRDDKLQQIVKLVGPDVLPESQRLVLWIAEMLKNGFLQQNAFDPIDMYCTPEKQVWLLRLMLDVHDRSLKLVTKNVPLAKIRELTTLVELVRCRSVIKNEEKDKMEDLEKRVQTQLDELERSYQVIKDPGLEYLGASRIAGPLLAVEGIHDVSFDELAEIRDPAGNLRLGRVLEVSDKQVIVQVLEGTSGLSGSTSRIRFLGESLRLAVSSDMLGRVFDGLGRPSDGRQGRSAGHAAT